jgi:Tol biopolymer transport system component
MFGFKVLQNARTGVGSSPYSTRDFDMRDLCSLRSLMPLTACALTLGLAACGSDSDSASSAGSSAPGPGAVVGIPDGSDIWVFNRYEVVGGGLTLDEPRNMTSRPGYDNQPSFTPSGQLLFTQGEGERTDLWRWQPADGVRHRITLSMDESEYSPTAIPGSDGISFIKVEADSTQRLWRINLDGTREWVLTADIAPVGYHAWLSATTVALYVLADEEAGTPSTLQVAKFSTGPDALAVSTAPQPSVRTVAENIGRSLQSIPGRDAVSFTQPRDGGWTLMEYDLERDRVSRITDLPEGTQDHAWTPEGDLLTAVGGQFFMWADNDWKLIADWSRLGQTFSRIAVNPEGRHVAVVGEPTDSAGS